MIYEMEISMVQSSRKYNEFSVSSNIPTNCGQIHFYAPKENDADNDQKKTKYEPITS